MEEEIIKIIKKNLNPQGQKFILELLEDYEINEYYRLSDLKLTEELSQVAHDINHSKRCLVIADRLINLFKKLNIKYEQVSKRLCDEKEVNMCIFAAIIMHDIGNAINRSIHHQVSSWLAIFICRPRLKKLFPKKHPLFLSMIISGVLRHQFESDLAPKDLASIIVSLADKLDISQERSKDIKIKDFINTVTNEVLKIELYIKKKKLQIDVLIKNPCALFRVEKLKGFIDKIPSKFKAIININVYLVKYRSKIKIL